MHAFYKLYIDVPLQRKILENNSSVCPDKDFLQSFAAIIGSRWQCLASPLSLTSEDIVSNQERDKRSRADQTSTHHAAEVGSQGDGNLWSVEREAPYTLSVSYMRTLVSCIHTTSLL